MGKITDYEKATSLMKDNVFLMDGVNGTKGINANTLAEGLFNLVESKDVIKKVDLSQLSVAADIARNDKLIVGNPQNDGSIEMRVIDASDFYYEMLDAFADVNLRRNTYRGTLLGTSVSDIQKTNIRNSSFKGFFTGDYWADASNRKFCIADFNYHLNCGDTAFVDPHLNMISEKSLYNTQMNTSNTTSGGYIGSTGRKNNLAQARTIVNALFSGLVKTHRMYLINAVANGRPSNGEWTNSDLEFLNQVMVYGYDPFSLRPDGSNVPSLYTIDNSQLAIFRLNPALIKIRDNYWLRDVVSAAYFACVGFNGGCAADNASISLGVRPGFDIG